MGICKRLKEKQSSYFDQKHAKVTSLKLGLDV